MNWKAYSNKGSEREVNEDCVDVSYRGKENVMAFAVADGMGDYDYGDQASFVVVRAALHHIDSNLYRSDIKEVLTQALEFADSSLEKFCVSNKCKSGVAVAIGVIRHNDLYFSWQGNVRIYHCGNLGWSQITSDHTLHIGKVVYRLTRCLKGSGLREDIPVGLIHLKKGDRLTVCTDGFYSSSRDIQAIINSIFMDHNSDKKCNFIDDCSGIYIEI